MVIAKARGIPLAYDPIGDLAPIAQVGLSTTLFLVNAESKFSSFQDFISHAKANPGKLNFGSNGYGGSYHLALEQIKALAGVDIAHVPFRGGAPSMLELLAGRVDAIFASTSLGLPQLSGGKVKLLALGSGQRSDLYPGVPTIAEAGYPGFDVSLGLGLFAPRDTPGPLITKINTDVNRLLVDVDLLSKLKEEGITATPGTPAQFQARLAADLEATVQLVRRLNIKNE